ncbi:MAG: ribbon-helix-helix protein, CopG family [Elusimicrobia bacterium]|nr:ribbon-helix-helix protein, CopG family [Elusimicrobiota bacterium]
MNKQTVTFRLDAQRRKALDAIAAGLDRDRSYVLNEAISNYLEVHQWQAGHIKEGLRQANAGMFAKEADVAAAFRRRRK